MTSQKTPRTAQKELLTAKIKRLWQKGEIFKETCRYHDRREFFECVFESNDPQIYRGKNKLVLEDRLFEELCITDARDFCDYFRFFKLIDVLRKFLEAIGRGTRFDHLWDNPIDDKCIARFLMRHNFKGRQYRRLKPCRTRLAVLLLDDVFEYELDQIQEVEWEHVRKDSFIAEAVDRYFFKLVVVKKGDFDPLTSYSNHVYSSSLTKFSRNPKIARVQRFIRGDMNEVDAFLAKDLGAKIDGADYFIRGFLRFSFYNMPCNHDPYTGKAYELERKCISKIMSDSNNFSRFVFRAIDRFLVPILESHLSLLRFDVEHCRPVYGRRVYKLFLKYNMKPGGQRDDLILISLLQTGSAAQIRCINKNVEFDIDHILTVKPDLESRIFELLYENAFVYNRSSKEILRDCFRRRPLDSDLERAYKSILTGRPDPVPLLKCLLEKQIKCYKRKWMSICKEKVLAKIPRI